MADMKVKVYAASSALTAEPCIDSKGRHTVSLDVAQGHVPNYDWNNKLQLWLMPSELPLFLGVLLGWVPATEGRHHGPTKDKGFELIHQGGNVFFKITQAQKGVRAIPIAGADLLTLSSLVTYQLLQNTPWMTSDTLLTLLKNTIGRTSAHNASIKRAG